MSEILDFTPNKRLLKPSKVDTIIYQVLVILSYYFAIFGKFFGVSRLAILSITAITVFGIKYGYTLDNIRALIAQSRLETGDFTSRMAKEDNNLFGMHFPFSRDTYCVHGRWNATEVADVAVYDSYLSSVLDRFEWGKQWKTTPIDRKAKVDDYMSAVNVNYQASAEDYFERWQSLYNEKPSLFDSVCYSLIAGCLPIIYLIFKQK